MEKSRGKNCFKNGKQYQHLVALLMSKIRIDDTCYPVEEVSGSKSGSDILMDIPPYGKIGIEVKNKGAFEGGSIKMVYSQPLEKLVFPEETIHHHCLGDIQVYDGKNLPWYEGKRTTTDYKNNSVVFDKEVKMPILATTMSDYYKKNGVHYIQIEKYGFYHTGNDILQLGVPFFECEQYLRIRTSKHKAKIDGIRVPTDVVGDINYNKKSLKVSMYDLNGTLPPSMKVAE